MWGVGEDMEGEGRLFLSAGSVYITKEESLEYRPAGPCGPGSESLFSSSQGPLESPRCPLESRITVKHMSSG